MLNKDYKDILQSFIKNDVKFLVVGAYAMGAYGYPRATGDIDIWVETSEENSAHILEALNEFGAPTDGVDTDTFSEKGIVFQIGVPPRRIDILTEIDGVEFEEAYSQKEDIDLDGLQVSFISMIDLIKNKEATGRDKDRLDVKNLKQNGDGS